MRITETQKTIFAQTAIAKHNASIMRATSDIASGLRVRYPSDTNQGGVIVELQSSALIIQSDLNRSQLARSVLEQRENGLNTAMGIMIEMEGLAAQAGSSQLSVEDRRSLAATVWAMREQLLGLANEKSDGRYLYGGVDDDDPPFDIDSTTYVASGSPQSGDRVAFDNFDGQMLAIENQEVAIGNYAVVTLTSNGGQVFSTAFSALERLGRALEGFRTDDQSGDYSALQLPQDAAAQSSLIIGTIDDFKGARASLEQERSSIGAMTRSLLAAEEHLTTQNLARSSRLSELQATDMASAISSLMTSRAALEATYKVTAQMLQRSLLNYL